MEFYDRRTIPACILRIEGSIFWGLFLKVFEHFSVFSTFLTVFLAPRTFTIEFLVDFACRNQSESSKSDETSSFSFFLFNFMLVQNSPFVILIFLNFTMFLPKDPYHRLSRRLYLPMALKIFKIR